MRRVLKFNIALSFSKIFGDLSLHSVLISSGSGFFSLSNICSGFFLLSLVEISPTKDPTDSSGKLIALLHMTFLLLTSVLVPWILKLSILFEASVTSSFSFPITMVLLGSVLSFVAISSAANRRPSLFAKRTYASAFKRAFFASRNFASDLTSTRDNAFSFSILTTMFFFSISTISKWWSIFFWDMHSTVSSGIPWEDPLLIFNKNDLFWTLRKESKRWINFASARFWLAIASAKMLTALSSTAEVVKWESLGVVVGASGSSKEAELSFGAMIFLSDSSKGSKGVRVPIESLASLVIVLFCFFWFGANDSFICLFKFPWSSPNFSSSSSILDCSVDMVFDSLVLGPESAASICPFLGV